MAVVGGLIALLLGAAFVLLVFAVSGQRDAGRLALRSQEAITAGTDLEKTVISLENGLRSRAWSPTSHPSKRRCARSSSRSTTT
jgi:hypothetical protein